MPNRADRSTLNATNPCHCLPCLAKRSGVRHTEKCMLEDVQLSQLLKTVTGFRERLAPLRENILADVIMCGEIPSPTFEEAALTRFMRDRFNESSLQNISEDEMGNACGLLPGSEGKRHILVAAHVDKVWSRAVEHTVSVTPTQLRGPGIADNSLGAAAITMLPGILSHLGIELKSNLLLVGSTRSLGRGDLAGLQFFIENSKHPIDAALCVEGVQLGRLSYSSLGMIRGEIHIHAPELEDWTSYNNSGAIVALNRIIDLILGIETPARPETSIILGSVSAGTAYNVPPGEAVLRFEVRSEQHGIVARILARMESIIAQINAEDRVRAELSVIARRHPGGIDFSHPLVQTTRALMNQLGIKPKVAPSTGELSTLVDKNIPAITLGLTRGESKNALDETIKIDPLFTGLAQLIGVLCAIDQGVCDEQD